MQSRDQHSCIADFCVVIIVGGQKIAKCLPEGISARINTSSIPSPQMAVFSTADHLPQQFLYFLPLPQGQGPLRDGLLDTTFSGGTAKGCSIAMGSSAIGLLFDNTRRFW